jgi:hypothetical protein
MPKILICLCSLILLSSCSKKNKVYLVKQWHLSPGESTLDVELSKKNPKFQNQMDIFTKVKLLVEKGTGVVIAEGCEDESVYYKENFNGWDLESLKTKSGLKELDDVLAPVPLKIKAELGSDIEVVCGDNQKLLKENSLAFSDLRGFTNFFLKLFESDGKNQKEFNKYKKALANIVDLKKDSNSIQVAKEKALHSLSRFEELIKLRNYHFVKSIAENISRDPVVVIGGFHIKGIVKELEDQGIDFEVITPEGYPKEEDLLVDNIKALLDRYQTRELVLYQMPAGFKLSKFPFKNLIKKSQLAGPEYLKELESIADNENIPFEALQSDFDRDGVRDFTLSATGGVVIISAEDNDWDNDGIVNLLDETLGDQRLFRVNVNSLDVANSYMLSKTTIEEEVKKLNKSGISLLHNSGVKHDLLILKVLNEVLKETVFPAKNLKVILATNATFTYGRQSFFSYNKQSKTLEIYANTLLNYLATKKEKEYQKVKIKDFVNGVVIPIIVHSLSHEIGHARDVDHENIASKNGWRWEEKKIESLYLSNNRNASKRIEKTIMNVTFKGKSYQSYLEDHKNYLSEINKALKSFKSDIDFKDHIKKTKWYVPSKVQSKELQASFLLNIGAPSLYSLSSISEWYAESYAACIFNRLYPAVESKEEAVRFEVLIGFNPYPMSSICQ